MSEKIVNVVPAMLKWARESQGYSIHDVALHLRRDPAEIEAWESGKAAPTYGQLEKVAYKLYKRPLAVFFLPKPPSEPSLKKEFRTLPEFEIETLASDTRYQLRFASALQLSLKELSNGINRSERKIFRDIKLSDTADIRQQAAKVRKYLGIPLALQRSWKSADVALKAWRNAVEDSGVFVFKQAFKQKEISGFCLLDAEFPLIYLNNSTTKTRQVFSLFHELTHLLFNVNGISRFEKDYFDRLPQQQRRIEQFCNALTAELLMPSGDFDKRLNALGGISDQSVEELATQYSVSREAVLRRLLDKKLVSKAFYKKKAREWAAQMENDIGSRGNYYATQAAYLGERYLQLVFGEYYKGHLTLEQAADHLGVRTRSVAGLEELALRKSVPA